MVLTLKKWSDDGGALTAEPLTAPVTRSRASSMSNRAREMLAAPAASVIPPECRIVRLRAVNPVIGKRAASVPLVGNATAGAMADGVMPAAATSS